MSVTFKKTLDVDKIMKDRIIVQAGLILGAIGENAAKALCPVQTGNLRGSITHEQEGRKVNVLTRTEYAEYVEFGTRFQKAQPFLEPSQFYVEQNVKEIIALCKREIK